MNYFLNRSREASTWIGMALVMAVAGWCVWHWHAELHHVVEAVIGAILAAAPDRAPELLKSLLSRHVEQPSAITLTPTIPSSKEVTVSLFDELKAGAESKIATAIIDELGNVVAGKSPAAQKFYADFKAALASNSLLGWAQLATDAVEDFHAIETAVAAPVPEQPAA